MCFLRILLVLSVTLCMLSYSYLFFSPLLLWVFVLFCFFFWYIFSVFPHFPYQGFNFHMKSFSRVPKSCFSIFPPLLIYCTLCIAQHPPFFLFLSFHSRWESIYIYDLVRKGLLFPGKMISLTKQELILLAHGQRN